MLLRMLRYPVTRVEWGRTTHYDAGTLVVDRQHLINHVRETEGLSVEISGVDLLSPGTSSRAVNIFDTFAARARLGEGAVDYPGCLGALGRVGDGETAALDDFTVLALSARPDKYHKLLDMSGPGSRLTPYAACCHVAVRAEPTDPGMSDAAYFGALKRVGLAVGSYLARATGSSATPARVDSYSLEPRPQGLPRAVFVFMLASHQRSEPGEPILYGDDSSGLHPTVLHPNEVLDGAVVAPYWNLGIDSYTFQNNPVLEGLYRRHGKEVDLAGVVVFASHVTHVQRERSVLMATNLTREILKADVAVITKVGGGIPESDVMMLAESLEARGVRASGVMWSAMGDGTVSDSLSSYSPAADALASAGIQDDWIDLPEQVDVVGGDEVGPFSDDPKDTSRPAHASLRVRYRDISGAISQLGASHVGQMEF